MKETIFKKSLELFTNNGFKSVTMDDIANELGISKKTIYQHFSSKNELVKETVDFVFQSAINKMKSFIGKCETPIHEHFAMKKERKSTRLNSSHVRISYAVFSLKKNKKTKTKIRQT